VWDQDLFYHNQGLDSYPCSGINGAEIEKNNSRLTSARRRQWGDMLNYLWFKAQFLSVSKVIFKMNSQTLTAALTATAIALFIPSWVSQAQTSSLVAIKPSLSNGVLCVARTTVGKGRIVFYTSTIDYSTMKKGGQKVTVNINQAPSTSFQVETQIVAVATTSYMGNKSYAGKTEAGKPLSFSLTSDLSKITVNYGAITAKGTCD
jgi:hypothetical protein